MGAGRGALAGAGRADHRRVHDQFTGGPEGAFGQVEINPDGGVPAAAGAAAGAPGSGAGPEEGVHDVAEREASAAEPARPGTGPGERVRTQVVHLPLLRVGQHLIRLGDFLEPLLGLRVRVDVRMEFPGQPAVGLLDIVRACVAADPKDPVVVVHGHDPAARIWPTYRATARTAPIAVG